MNINSINRTTIAFVVVCSAVAAVVSVSLQFMRRDHKILVDQFSEEHLAQINEITAQLEQNFSQIERTLHTAGQLAQNKRPTEELTHDLGVFMMPLTEFYQLQLYDVTGALKLSVQNPSNALFPALDLVGATAETVSAALISHTGAIQMSVPLKGETSGWHRIFAVALFDEDERPIGAMAALIDTQALFQKARILTTDSGAKLLILSSRGRSTPATYPELAKALEHLPKLRPQLPKYGELVDQMRSGERGILRISAKEAKFLRMGNSELIAVYGPIHVGSVHWSAATITSTESLQSLERALQLRFGLAAVLISFCLVAFGLYTMRVSRREIAIREQLKNAESLAHLHEKTEKILDQIPTGVIVLSETGQITSFNRPLKEKLPLDVVGRDLAFCFSGAPRPVIEHLQALIYQAQSEGQIKSTFNERLSLFGEEGLYHLHAVPLEPHDPEARTLVVIEDVSKVRQLESQLLRAEKLSTAGVLAAGIAHEVGTPLGVVRWRAENILSKLGAQHPQSASVKVIIEQVDQVTRIIRQLLDFSRVKPAQVRPVALDSVSEEIEELLRFEGERRKIKLHIDIPTILPLLAADPSKLQQVLVNLLLNAFDACHDGGTVAFVAFEERDPQNSWRRIRMEVIDNGCGIPKEKQHRVFDPFFTTKKRGQGTGLGLSIASQIIRDHGGQIELESESGHGTRVIVYWPASEQTQEAAHES